MSQTNIIFLLYTRLDIEVEIERNICHYIFFKVGGDGEEDKIFFIWPTTIVHKINKYSPLHQMSATDLLRERFEIVVILGKNCSVLSFAYIYCFFINIEGVIESTGMTTQARSSYLPSEILWGHRFESLITFRKGNGEYEVDYALFNNTIEVETPLCSAKQLEQHREAFSSEGCRGNLFYFFKSYLTAPYTKFSHSIRAIFYPNLNEF